MKKSITLIIIGFLSVTIVITANILNKNSKSDTDSIATYVSSDLLDLQRVLAIEDTTEKLRQLTDFFTVHMSNKPIKTLSMLEKLNTLDNQQLCYDFALTKWSTTDPALLISWLKNKEPNIYLNPALIHLIQQSTQIENSLLFANKISTATLRQRELTQLFQRELPLNAKPIIYWAINNRIDSHNWLTLAFKLISIDSPTKAIHSLNYLNINNIAQIRISLQSIIDHYRFGVIELTALQTLQSLEPYKLKEEATAALLPLLVNEQHISLNDVRALLESLEAGELQDELYELLALNWANKDPHEAGRYAASLTGDTRARAMSAVVATWVKKDLGAADEWLKNMTGNLDLAASTIGREAAKLGNMQISDEWLDDIIEEDIRTQAIVDVIQSYYKESPASGIYNLVYQKNLSSQKKLEILHEIYPDELFLYPMQALDEIDRLEGLTNAY